MIKITATNILSEGALISWALNLSSSLSDKVQSLINGIVEVVGSSSFIDYFVGTATTNDGGTQSKSGSNECAHH